jgi:hypothetical protein
MKTTGTNELRVGDEVWATADIANLFASGREEVIAEEGDRGVVLEAGPGRVVVRFELSGRQSACTGVELARSPGRPIATA